jgi:hypothetical protein
MVGAGQVRSLTLDMSDAAREQRQPARLGRRREGRAAERFREPEAEVEIGDEIGAAPEPFCREILLERAERARRVAELDQRRRPRVMR